MTCQIQNKIVGVSIGMFIQILLVFAFLTVFFFTYVVNVEKHEFQKQASIVTDEIVNGVIDKLPVLVEKQDKLSKNDANVIINGVLSVIEEKAALNTGEVSDKIDQDNRTLKKKNLATLTIIMGVVSAIAASLYLAGYCLYLPEKIKDTLIVVFFVGVAEFFFLTFVASRYISADPNAIKRSFAQGVKDWIKKNKKI